MSVNFESVLLNRVLPGRNKSLKRRHWSPSAHRCYISCRNIFPWQVGWYCVVKSSMFLLPIGFLLKQLLLVSGAFDDTMAGDQRLKMHQKTSLLRLTLWKLYLTIWAVDPCTKTDTKRIKPIYIIFSNEKCKVVLTVIFFFCFAWWIFKIDVWKLD